MRSATIAHAGLDRDERIFRENPDQVRVPADADFPTEERERHRIKRASDFDVPIGVDRFPAACAVGWASGCGPMPVISTYPIR